MGEFVFPFFPLTHLHFFQVVPYLEIVVVDLVLSKVMAMGSIEFLLI